MLDDFAGSHGGLFPMIRGRIVAANGVDAEDWERDHRPVDAPGPRLQSERNLTWAADLPEDNQVVKGRWWSPDETGALVSLEDEYAESLGLDVGDRLRFDIAGRFVEVEVASLRRLDWESMRPNFFIIFAPKVLGDFPATYMTSFYLERDEKPFLNRFLARFPTVTVIEIDVVIEQVRGIINQVSAAIELVLVVILFAGALVLIAGVQSSVDTRLYEGAILRALGARRSLILGGVVIEFAALGFFAGLLASLRAIFVRPLSVFRAG